MPMTDSMIEHRTEARLKDVFPRHRTARQTNRGRLGASDVRSRLHSVRPRQFQQSRRTSSRWFAI